MQKYYTAKENPNGEYVSVNHVRYSVNSTDKSRIHIPIGREDDITFHNTEKSFLDSMGLESAVDHVFPSNTNGS